MDHFEYRDATLYAEDVKISDIAAQVGTPFYCYSSATLRHHYHILADAMAQAGLPDTLICFSVKANSNIAVIGTLAQLGAGADIVSQGELTRALKAGVPAEKIVFSGVGKTAEEMRAALAAGPLESERYSRLENGTTSTPTSKALPHATCARISGLL